MGNSCRKESYPDKVNRKLLKDEKKENEQFLKEKILKEENESKKEKRKGNLLQLIEEKFNIDFKKDKDKDNEKDKDTTNDGEYKDQDNENLENEKKKVSQEDFKKEYSKYNKYFQDIQKMNQKNRCYFEYPAFLYFILALGLRKPQGDYNYLPFMHQVMKLYLPVIEHQSKHDAIMYTSLYVALEEFIFFECDENDDIAKKYDNCYLNEELKCIFTKIIST